MPNPTADSVTMTPGEPSARHEWLQFWEDRELSFLTVLPYVMLVIASAMDVASRRGLTAAAMFDLALAAASAL